MPFHDNIIVGLVLFIINPNGKEFLKNWQTKPGPSTGPHWSWSSRRQNGCEQGLEASEIKK
jgi:hypothetical protein